MPAAEDPPGDENSVDVLALSDRELSLVFDLANGSVVACAELRPFVEAFAITFIDEVEERDRPRESRKRVIAGSLLRDSEEAQGRLECEDEREAEEQTAECVANA